MLFAVLFEWFLVALCLKADPEAETTDGGEDEADLNNPEDPSLPFWTAGFT